jgi:AhpC/TSA family
MSVVDARQQFEALDTKFGTDEYNFEHFRFEHFVWDLKQTLTKGGIRPGSPAPDFELPRVGGGVVRLRDLRDKPVLLRFGSFT